MVARGLVEHVDQDIIYDAMCEELIAADYKIDSLLDVQKIVFNALVERVMSSNKRTRNMVYNILKKLAYREVSLTDQIIVGIRRCLTPEYQKQYDNKPKHRSWKDQRKMQDQMSIWYPLLTDKPGQFMEPILRKLHVDNYLLTCEEGFEYVAPPRITYNDPLLVLCEHESDEDSQ